MKKLLSLLTAVLFFIACEGPMGPEGLEGPMGPEGPRGKDGYGTNWYSTTITVSANEWQLKGNPNDLNSYFYVYKPLSQLTKSVYDKGTVISYIETQPGIKNGMPYVLHLGEAEGTKEFLWTQTYDFDFTPGEIGFYVSYSDFNTQMRPGTEKFHVVLMW